MIFANALSESGCAGAAQHKENALGKEEQEKRGGKCQPATS